MNRRITRTASKAAPDTESWSDHRSSDWDVLRVLASDELLVPDSLLALPPKNFTYTDSQGRLKDPDKYYVPKAQTTLHPKLATHIKNGTDTSVNRRYYKDMPPNRVLPLAGLIREDPDPRVSVVREPLDRGRGDRASAAADVLFPGLRSDSILTPDEIQEENFHARPSIRLIIPDHIKAILVDDWENVTKNQQLVPLPAARPVSKILEDYLEFEKPRRQEGSAQADILEEVVAGLKEYFEKCLGRILLYRFERNQYIEVREGWASSKGDFAGKTACQTYGAEHLCRLLVTLPELIAQTNMDMQSVNRLREELTKMTNWLGKNTQTYFVSEYETPSQDYVEKARSV